VDVSVVIPTFQRCGSVARILGALADQSLPSADYEVIVAIDGSEDGTREMVAEYRTPFELRSSWQPNRGRAAACNSGIRAARGDLIVILDDDMVPSRGCLEAHLAAHPQGSRRCVMGTVPIRTTAESRPLEKYVARRFNAHLRRLSEDNHRFQTRDFYSGNASVRRDVVLSAGLFDESFDEYGNEDLELAVRLRSAGVEIGFSPAALAVQKYEKTFRQLAADTTSKGRTAVGFAAKHPEIRGELQLAQFGLRSWRWRLALRLLLVSTRLAPGIATALASLTTAFEHGLIRRLDPWYQLLLDYYYWLGVGEALRREGLAG
jgi:GT2 family glycosyltransferase